MYITARAIVEPLYLNASRDFTKWFSHNWRMLEQYFEQLGGDKYDTDEYVAFCRCQFDRQQLSERDVKLVNDIANENARLRVRELTISA